jgi:hypothetical protein
LYPWDRLRPILKEAMNSIQALQQTAAAMLVFRGFKALSAAAAAEVGR